MTQQNWGGAGLLLAMMEPSPSFEEEFQDWYDSEHFPERCGTNGFVTANRLICLQGWPRYLALYDLSQVDVLRGESYARIAGNNYSIWTRRIVPRVWGHYRAEGTQIYPGEAMFGDQGRASRVILWRFREVPSKLEPKIPDALETLYAGRDETAQIRVFRCAQESGTDYVGIVELHFPYEIEPQAVAAFGDARKHLDLVNAYVCYNRN